MSGGTDGAAEPFHRADGFQRTSSASNRRACQTLSLTRTVMLLWGILCFSVLHFGLWFLSAFIAYGFDLDQVRTRSVLANSAAAPCSVLQYPHDVLLRSLPSQWLEQVPQMAMVVVLVSSLLWGVGLCIIWQLFRARRKLGNPVPRIPPP